MGRNYLVTGGAGFIGSNFIEHLAAVEPDGMITNLDLLTYAGVTTTVQYLDELGNHRFVKGDIRDTDLVDTLIAAADVVVNFAAESHVDRSITNPGSFLSTNVMGAAVLLEAARRHETPVFVQVSTDEVYGSIAAGVVAESAPLRPASPYSASKAAADLLVEAYRQTYGYPAIITRCTNNYGPRQFPEKLIPLSISRLVAGDAIPLYGDGRQERDWIDVRDHCAALSLIIDRGASGETYNIASGTVVRNQLVADMLLAEVGDGSVEYVADRPGHDRRYAIDSTKLRNLGWRPTVPLDRGLRETVDWYRRNRDWWMPLVGRQ